MSDLPSATPDPMSPRDEADALAAELSLRVLDAAQEAEARARADRDSAFAAQVEAWDARFADFAEEVAPIAPSAAVWPAISRKLDMPSAPAANDNGRVAFWRGWALGSTGLLAASLAAVAVLALRPPAPAPAPVAPAETPHVLRVATLTLQDGGQAALTLVYDATTNELYLAPADGVGLGEGVPHLWLVSPEGGVQLVGAIDGQGTSRRRLDAALTGRAGQAQAVAISLEPAGTTPAPTQPGGPVVAQGALQRL